MARRDRPARRACRGTIAAIQAGGRWRDRSPPRVPDAARRAAARSPGGTRGPLGSASSTITACQSRRRTCISSCRKIARTRRVGLGGQIGRDHDHGRRAAVCERVIDIGAPDETRTDADRIAGIGEADILAGRAARTPASESPPANDQPADPDGGAGQQDRHDPLGPPGRSGLRRSTARSSSTGASRRRHSREPE